MRTLQFKITCLLFMVGSAMLFAQKVHYKGGYYTLVNQKIFHRGHNVYGKLTEGQRDTIYMTAQELYNERGKLKPHYKKRRGTDKYKLPEGYWENKAKEAAQAKIAANTNNADSAVAVADASSSAKEKEVVQNLTSQNQSGQVVASSERENLKQEEKSSGTVAKPQDVSNSKKEEEIARKEKELQHAEEKSQKEIKKAEEKTEKAQKQLKKENSEVSGEFEKEQKDKKAEVKKAERAASRKEKQVKKDREKVAEEKTSKAEKKIEKSEKSLEKKERKLEKSEKKAKKERKDAKKSIRKEEKKLDKKEKKIKKANKELKNKEKQLKTAEKVAEAATATSVATQVKSNNFGTIYFKIDKEKTVVDSLGRIKLYFNIVNNSDKELVLLKPNNTYNSRLDFFASNVDCEEIAITTSSEAELEAIKITENDYLVVQPNSTSELMMNGDYYGNLECGKDDVVLKIEYNPYQIVEQGIQYNEAQQKEFRKAFEKITRMKIESENVKFELNKQ